MLFGAWLTVSFIIFCATIVLAVVLSRLPYKRDRFLTPRKVLFAGAFLCAVIVVFPVQITMLFEEHGIIEYLKTLMLTLTHSVSIFAFGGGYTDIFESEVVRNLDKPLTTLYSCYGAILHVLTPMLSLTFVISLFRDVTSQIKYTLSFKKHTHVFSELNEKSITLAKSIDDTYNKKNGNYLKGRKELFVFNGVDRDSASHSDLIETAKELGAILFKKDISAVKYKTRNYEKRALSFYLISENEDDNVRLTTHVMDNYDLPNVDLHVFSSDVRAALLLAARDQKNMKVVRVNESQSLVYNALYNNGLRLFENARELGGEKVISAAIVGLGKYGIEMLKALSWFGQMDGYRLKIRAFDKDEAARDRFATMCPELLSPNPDGKTEYDIDVFSGVDIGSSAFEKAFSAMDDATYVFVCLGNDLENLEAATKIKALTERIKYQGDGKKPDIETVIYDSGITETMGKGWGECDAVGVKNFDKQCYDIHMIGNLDQLYSVDTMLNSALTAKAEKDHTSYAEHEYNRRRDLLEEVTPEKLEELENVKKQTVRAFHKYEYYHRSTVARMIHKKQRAALGIENPELEHKRWNAYMRSEGYRFSGSIEPSTKNHLAKLHHNLVPCSELTDKHDIKKDT